MILLTWDPVPDADSYTVIRKDINENISKEFELEFEKNEIDDHYYLKDTVIFDSASDDNIINGHSYAYTVYSKPSNSGSGADGFIGHGKTSSNTVTANVPAQNKVDWIAVNQASIKIERLEDTANLPGSDSYQPKLLVSWDAKPNLEYTVKYYPLAENSTSGTKTVVSPLKSKAYATFNEEDGKNTISISAYFIKGTAYYTKTDVKIKDVVIPGITAPYNFKVEFKENSDRNLQITWDKKPYETGVTYKLEKSEFEVGGDGIWRQGYNHNNITKFIKWETIPVTETAHLFNKGVVFDEHADTSYNKYFVYRLVAIKDGLTSEPVYSTDDPSSSIVEKGIFIKAHYFELEEVDYNHRAITLKIHNNYADVGANSAYGVSSIKLYRRIFNDDGKPQGPYAEVASLTNTATQLVVEDSNKVESGTEYQYRISVKGAGDTTFVDLDQDAVETSASPMRGNLTSFSVGSTTHNSIFLVFNGTYLGGAPVTIEYKKSGDIEYTPVNTTIGARTLTSNVYYYNLARTDITASTTYNIRVRYDESLRGGIVNATTGPNP
jgi:hypothetical protein